MICYARCVVSAPWAYHNAQRRLGKELRIESAGEHGYFLVRRSKCKKAQFPPADESAEAQSGLVERAGKKEDYKKRRRGAW
jgi:hypothetical protein